MRKLLILLACLLAISTNFFIFCFGLIESAKASSHYESVKVKYLLNSALTLAIHHYEDSGRSAELQGEDMLGKDVLIHTINEIDKDKVYVKLRVKHKGSDFTADYICDK